MQTFERSNSGVFAYLPGSAAALVVRENSVTKFALYLFVITTRVDFYFCGATMSFSISTRPLIILICLTCSVLLVRLPYADAHGFLAQPASRNVYAYLQGTFYDPMSGNGVGTTANTGGPGRCRLFLLLLSVQLIPCSTRLSHIIVQLICADKQALPACVSGAGHAQLARNKLRTAAA